MSLGNALNIQWTTNQLIYANGSNTLTGLATGNNGVLITSVAGVPSISSTLPNAVQDNITRLGTIASIGAPLGAQFGGTGVTNLSGSTITLGGSLTLSGAFTTAFTITGNTSVTFPTSGTLATTAGTVASITGTPNRITIGGTATNPTVDIASTYVGQNSITTVGALSSGSLAAGFTPVTVPIGGTGISTTTAYGVITGGTTATGAFQNAGAGLSGQILQSGGAAALPAYTTATYPATTTINQLLYSSSANTIAGLATANNGVLITSAGGVPSISSTLPSAVQGNITATGALASGSLAAGFTPVTVPLGGTGNTTFTAYSVICAGTTATGTFQNVSGVGTNGYVLTSNGAGALPTWQATGAVTGVASVSGTLNQIDVSPTTGNCVVSIDANYVGQTSITTLGTISTGTWAGTTIALNHGGTNAALTASNGGIVWSNATQMQILSGTATANQMLQSGSTATPAWSTATWPATTTINQILYSSSANTVAGLATANKAVLTTGATGIPVLTAIATDGQIIIGSTAGVPAAATLTAGTGITVTNAGNSITIAATGASTGTLLNVQTFTSGSSATYTPTAGTSSILVKIQGGGGGGGGSTCSAAQGSAASGGGGGGYIEYYLSGVSGTYTYTVGGGGAGAVGNGTGSTGSNSVFNGITASGGAGGAGTGSSSSAGQYTTGGGGGAASGGKVNIAGFQGGPGLVMVTAGAGVSLGGYGGNSMLGQGGVSLGITNGATTGSAGQNYGGGGCGGACSNTGSSSTGGAGAGGIIIVYEYK